MLHEERGAARSEMLEMWGSGALSMDVSNKGSAPSKGRSAVGEESGVWYARERITLREIAIVTGGGGNKS